MQITELKPKLSLVVEHLRSEPLTIRTGRATTSLVEDIEVEAYGDRMKVKELGTIATPDAQLIIITPWDKSLLKEIEKGIRQSSLALNPVVDTQVVKVPIPSLTEERRREFTKLVAEKCESAKQKVRGLRQDVMKDIDTQFANKEITEDDKFSTKEDVEKTVKEFVALLDDMAEKKKSELMTV